MTQLTVPKLCKIIKERNLSRDLYIFWENEIGNIIPVEIRNKHISLYANDQKSVYETRVDFHIDNDHYTKNDAIYCCTKKAKDYVQNWIDSKFLRSEINKILFSNIIYDVGDMITIQKSKSIDTIALGDFLDMVDTLWLMYDYCLFYQNEVKVHKKKTVNVYTNFTYGLGLNKRSINLGEHIIEPGKAIIINTATNINTLNNLPKDCYCSFSLYLLGESKPKKYTRDLYQSLIYERR